jgi:hypothetical protein
LLSTRAPNHYHTIISLPPEDSRRHQPFYLTHEMSRVYLASGPRTVVLLSATVPIGLFRFISFPFLACADRFHSWLPIPDSRLVLGYSLLEPQRSREAGFAASDDSLSPFNTMHPSFLKKKTHSRRSKLKSQYRWSVASGVHQYPVTVWTKAFQVASCC